MQDSSLGRQILGLVDKGVEFQEPIEDNQSKFVEIDELKNFPLSWIETVVNASEHGEIYDQLQLAKKATVQEGESQEEYTLRRIDALEIFDAFMQYSGGFADEASSLIQKNGVSKMLYLLSTNFTKYNSSQYSVLANISSRRGAEESGRRIVKESASIMLDYMHSDNPFACSFQRKKYLGYMFRFGSPKLRYIFLNTMQVKLRIDLILL